MKRLIIILTMIQVPNSHASELLFLHPGFVTKVRCEGRLLISAIGDDLLVQLEALPKELGCGVLLKPTRRAGKSSNQERTNLILETTTGTIRRIVQFSSAPSASDPTTFEYRLKGDTE